VPERNFNSVNDNLSLVSLVSKLSGLPFTRGYLAIDKLRM